MEALAELIPLLLVAGYYILAARRRAAKRRALQQQAQSAPEVTSEPRGTTPFQEFMEQLEEAMAEAAGEPEPTPPEQVAPAPKPAPKPRPTRPQRPSEFQAVEGSFDASRPSDHEAHGFGRENPFSEESFERRPAFVPRSTAPKPEFDPHGLRSRPEPQTQNRRLDDMRRRLRSAEAAREAFVLQTIFGPRGGRRAENR